MFLLNNEKYSEKIEITWNYANDKRMHVFAAVLPLVHVRPSSRSKPSGHSQLKEPLVLTHLEPAGQGSFSHSSMSEHTEVNYKILHGNTFSAFRALKHSC